MSSTRKAEPGAPLSQERYMSSPEYADHRPINGTAVAQKAAFVAHPRKRSLLLFLQAMSFQQGGLKQFAGDFLAAFPERLGSSSMRAFGMKAGKVYGSEKVITARDELGAEFRSPIHDREYSDLYFAYDCSGKRPLSATEVVNYCQRKASHLDQVLEEVCINPKLKVKLPGEPDSERCFSVPWFKDLVGSLYEYQEMHRKKVENALAHTTCARHVFQTLDAGLRVGKMVMIEGREGIGKSEAGETWCRMHPGEARYVPLTGITNKTNFFRSIARALGLASGRGQKTTEMQCRIEETLQRSGLMLVLDEAHYLLPQQQRMEAQPELLNWLYSASSSLKFPVGLLTTSIFGQRMDLLKKQVAWNSGQFERRIHTFTRLEEEPTKDDLMLVAAKLLPGVSQAGIKLVVGHAGSTRQHMTNLIDAVSEARLLAAEAGREKVTFEDLDKAIYQFRVPSEAAKAQAFKTQAGLKRGRPKSLPEPPAGPLQGCRNDDAEPVQEVPHRNRISPAEEVVG
jgi:hypothetical protein